MNTKSAYLVRRRFVVLFVLPGLIGLAGCKESRPAATYPVSGRVVFSDGAPLSTGGVVICESVPAEKQRTFCARAVIQADGTFRLSTFSDGDGAVAGKHRVLIKAQRGGDRDHIGPPVIDPRFEAFETSGLELIVEPPGNNQVKLVVERPRESGR